MEKLAVLVVDRDEVSRAETAELLQSEVPEASVDTAESLTAAEQRLAEEPVDVLVTGYVLPDGNGLELVEAVRSSSPATTCLLYTHSETIDTESFEEVIVDFVGKDTPDSEQTLVALVAEAGETLTQASHPLPEGEDARLEAVARTRPPDGEPLAPLERIATLAREHFDGTAAAVTLIERHTQTVLGSAGEELVPSTRDESLATHVLTQPGETLAVGDARVDPRFADVETIQTAGVVAYLGARIETADGDAIGVLSVYDDDRREFTAADHSYVETLAGLAADVLALADGGDGA